MVTIMYVVDPMEAIVGIGVMYGVTGAIASVGHVLILGQLRRKSEKENDGYL